jgi:acyl-CoA thioester hydrolase
MNFQITYGAPVTKPGAYAMRLWLEKLGTTSSTQGFRLESPDGTIGYAEGVRTIIRIDPATMRPAPWSDESRTLAEKILRRSA